GEQGRRDTVRRSVPVRSDAVRPGRLDRGHERGHALVFGKAEGDLSRTLGACGHTGPRTANPRRGVSESARRGGGPAASGKRMATIQATGRAAGFRFAVVVSKYNDFVTDRLQAGALEALAAAGVAPDDITVVRVPGAYEIPLAAQHAA